MILYYLGIPVEPLVRHTARGKGWVYARWPDGRIFLHWGKQLKKTPWGE